MNTALLLSTLLLAAAVAPGGGQGTPPAGAVRGARRVASIPSGMEEPYFWLPGGRVLTLDHARKTQFAASVVDAATGQSQPLTAFNRRFTALLTAEPMYMYYGGSADRKPDEVYYTPPECLMAPDGSRLLWRTNGLFGGHWIAATLDGMDHVYWPAAHDNYCAWMRDSRRWVEVVSSSPKEPYRLVRAAVHNIADPKQDRSVAITGLPDAHVLGITADGRLLTSPFGFELKGKPARLYAVRLDGPRAAAESYTVALPANWRLQDVELAPTGDRLAWLAGVSDTSQDFAAHRPSQYVLCVSDLHGGGMRPVAEIAGTYEKDAHTPGGTRAVWPVNVRWTPDGKRVSFAFNGGLYVADVAVLNGPATQQPNDPMT